MVDEATLPSDNPLRFRKNLLKWIYNKIMTIDYQIQYEKLQYDINREAAKVSPLSSGKINKHEYLTGEEIFPSNQNHITEQAKLTYSSLVKAFKNQPKILEAIKDSESDDNEELLKYNKIDELSDEKICKIYNIDFNNLTYYLNISPINSISFRGLLHI